MKSGWIGKLKPIIDVDTDINLIMISFGLIQEITKDHGDVSGFSFWVLIRDFTM
jgi:hypothetical protein